MRKQKINSVLSEEQTFLHEKAVQLVRKHRRVESDLIEVLGQIDQSKLFKTLGQPSLFAYAVNILGMSESVAYGFITVARKSNEVSKLKEAIQSQTLSVSKASRIVSALSSENAAQLIEFASTHLLREIDFEVARLNPKAKSFEKVRVISEDRVEMKLLLSKKAFQTLERILALESKGEKNSSKSALVEKALEFYLEKHDPVRKAERILKKKEAGSKDRLASKKEAARSPGKTLFNRVSESRKPLTAEAKHLVFKRDQGKCTHINANGKRCNSERWVEVHHVIPLSFGGTNDPKNLATLCSFHHDLTHQLSLPLEGQVTWLRAPTRKYQ